MNTDRALLYAGAFLRSTATGMCGVLLALYLAALGFSAGKIGFLVAIGLGSGALATVVVSRVADRLGRRRLLVAIGLLTAAGGVGLALGQSFMALAAASFVGMINGMGRERGAAVALEQAIFPQTTDDAGRTRAFAWYNASLDGGHAVGALLGALPALLVRWFTLDTLASYRWTLMVFAALALLTAVIPLALSSRVESTARTARPGLSRESRRRVSRIAALFALDSLGGGFLVSALLSYWFFKRFGVGVEWIAPLFFAARVANTVSYFGAVRLARRIGLVNTMVFTHIPSSLLLVAVTFAPTFWLAVVLFLVRELLVEMDVPTRQSYVMAIVRPEERMAASGVTTVVRSAGWAIAPVMAGPLMGALALSVPLYVGAGLKIVYDGLLYRG
ncbi:MAG: MFS transporter, partial [Candidatus Krumholzibacteria bacterium]|nr:MFS transporter [Candidatus Krumholzibacteria bacterium]